MFGRQQQVRAGDLRRTFRAFDHNRDPFVVPGGAYAPGVEADVDAFLLEDFSNGGSDIFVF